MRKKFSISLLVLILSISLIACGNKEEVVIDEESIENKTQEISKENKDIELEKSEEIEKSEKEFEEDLETFQEDLEDMSDELYENATDKGGYTNQEEQIWQYCIDRWDYYDELEGGYAGDKYTENVFEDAGNTFNISRNEAEEIWLKVDRAKLGI